MRVMVLVKGNKETEDGVMPTLDELTAMGAFNQELIDAGVMLDGDGLRASSHGARIDFEGETPTVTDGPFAETKELVAGYWVLEVKSMEEAVEWMRRAPFQGGAIELRPFMTPEDFAYAPEVVEAEQRQRDQVSAQHG